MTDSDLSNDEATPEEQLELVLEAARRANWDALHGPEHLRSGRYFVPGSPAPDGTAQQAVEAAGRE
jgi:hypothetical protein